MPHEYSEDVSPAIALNGNLQVRSPGKIMTPTDCVCRLCPVLSGGACSLGLMLLYRGRPMH